MADRYWVGGTATWSSGDTSKWSATSGGASGFSVPGSGDAAIIEGGTATLNYSPTLNRCTVAYGGALTTANYNINTTYFGVNFGGGATLGSSTITVTGTAANDILFYNTSMASATIVIAPSAAGTTTMQVASGNTAIGTISMTPVSSSVIQFGSSADFTVSNFTSSTGVAWTLELSLYTVSVAYWGVTGVSGAVVTLKSIGSPSFCPLTYTGTERVTGVDYMSIRDIHATPSTFTWYVGANSTNTSNNTGLIFTAAPPLAGSLFFGSNF